MSPNIDDEAGHDHDGKHPLVEGEVHAIQSSSPLVAEEAPDDVEEDRVPSVARSSGRCKCLLKRRTKGFDVGSFN